MCHQTRSLDRSTNSSCILTQSESNQASRLEGSEAQAGCRTIRMLCTQLRVKDGFHLISQIILPCIVGANSGSVSLARRGRCDGHNMPPPTYRVLGRLHLLVGVDDLGPVVNLRFNLIQTESVRLPIARSCGLCYLVDDEFHPGLVPAAAAEDLVERLGGELLKERRLVLECARAECSALDPQALVQDGPE